MAKLSALLLSLFMLCSCSPVQTNTETPISTPPVSGIDISEQPSADINDIPGTIEAPSQSINPSVSPSPQISESISPSANPGTSPTPAANPSPSPSPSPEPKVPSVSVVINGPDGVLADDYTEYSEGMTAFDALKSICEANGIEIVSRGLGKSIYIASIGGYAEFAYGYTSGWIYKVNGTQPSKSAAAVKLSADDIVEFVYNS